MMAQININVCMDEDLLQQFEYFCDEIGVSINTAFCIFAKTVVRERKFPFDLPQEDDPFYSSENLMRLQKAIADLEAGKGTVHELIEGEGIVRKKTVERKRSIEELFEGFDGEYNGKEIDCGKSVGNEVW